MPLNEIQKAALTKFKAKRASLKRKITVFVTFLAEANSNAYDEVKFRYEAIVPILDNFETIQIEIEALEPIGEQDSYQDEFEKKYYDAIRDARRFLKERESVGDSELNETIFHSAPEAGSVRLPKIDLPTFDGQYDAWRCFRDSFKSMVHEKPHITKIEKFYYLRACLKNEAATIIKSLETTEDNYSIAWSLIVERYDNKRVIVHNHLKNLLELPASVRESYVYLRQMLDSINTNTRALASLGLAVDKWDAIIIYCMKKKLDKVTHLEWERENAGTDLPTLDKFIDFLKSRYQILEATLMQNEPVQNSSNLKSLSGSNKRNVLAIATKPDYCSFCKGEHKIYTCEKFSNLTPKERYEFAKRERLCFNCLRKNHSTETCSCRPCKKCNRKHHTILHFEKVEKPNTPNTVNNLQISCPAQVLLATAKINFFDKHNRPQTARVLLDSGAQAHFITERFANLLKLPRERVNIPVSTLNQSQTNIINRVQTKISSRLNNYEKDISLLVVPSITSPLPSHAINIHELKIPQNLPLADPTFHQTSEIDALIGAEVYFAIDCAGRIPIGNTEAVLLKTRFGWTIGGSINLSHAPKGVACNHSINSLSLDISRFWELEETPDVKFLSREEAEVERHFLEHFRRDSDGRCIVKLPFNEKIQQLPNNYSIALKQFYSIERKLNKDPKLKEQYISFMSEYETLNHMSLSQHEEIENFIPHHAIFKNDNIRVVYNASSSMNCLSFNQAQLVGPTIQDDIFSILTRARLHKILLIADITKMYRQILVDKEHRKYQKIIWRASSHDPIKIYELNTLTYGTAAASYLAIRAIRQVAEEARDKYPLAAEIVKRDFYVDDLMTGTDSIESALVMRDQLITLLKSARLELRKWASNDKRVTNSLPSELANVQLFEDHSKSIKTLGIQWNPDRDLLLYSVRSDFGVEERITKRTILSKIAQLFDPVGLLGPILVKAKLIMQKLWKIQIDWDASLPLDIHTEWIDYRDQLPSLAALSFERRVLPDDPVNIQLHGFCDSSERAYGACIYLRSIDKKGNCITRLLCAKSKVAPLGSKLTIPKLELCAALILARLYKSLLKILPTIFDRVYFWSDSTIALNWINAQPSALKTFVANRVSEIQNITNHTQWKHVPTRDNPADYISRGQTVSDFIKNDIWKYGPVWLSTDDQNWPNLPLKPEPLTELRKTIVLNTRVDDNFELPKASSFRKLIRIIAYCKRFAHNSLITYYNRLPEQILPSNKERTGPLIAQELEFATRDILLALQRKAFSHELHELCRGKGVGKQSSLKTLNPFIDSQGLIRVGGRLNNALITYDEKHAVLLPKGNWVTDLIIKQTHEGLRHAGILATLYQVRSKYWPLNGKNITRRVIHNCIKCFRFVREHRNYLMGDLPMPRLVPTRPFLNTGIDYCGPFHIKEKKLRNRNKVKVYVAVFVCFATKAVHLEVVSDLTTDAFIACLKRFFARRGKSKNIYSDNGTNFVGANNELKRLYEFLRENTNHLAIFDALANESIDWHFTPPRTPHFGGLWESAVKSFKTHFLRTVGNALLSFEEFNTHTIEIEAVLNSRPISPISSDPNDLTALTPGHFLIGGKLMSTPDVDLSRISASRLSNWQRIQQLKQHFWTRWHKEYLNQLNVRNKWTSNDAKEVKIGSMVLLKEDNVPPLQWVIGRINALHPGDDGIVRVITVKTNTGTYKRSVNKIAILPMETINCTE